MYTHIYRHIQQSYTIDIYDIYNRHMQQSIRDVCICMFEEECVVLYICLYISVCVCSCLLSVYVCSRRSAQFYIYVYKYLYMHICVCCLYMSVRDMSVYVCSRRSAWFYIYVYKCIVSFHRKVAKEPYFTENRFSVISTQTSPTYVYSNEPYPTSMRRAVHH